MIKTNEIELIEGLKEFKEQHEVVYAIQSGKGVNKKICIDLAGWYKVYNNKIQVLKTKSEVVAIRIYLDI